MARAKTRTSRATRKRREVYPQVHHVSAPQQPDPDTVEEFITAPNGNVLFLRVQRRRYGFLAELMTTTGRSLPVSFGGAEPRTSREAVRMAKAWLDRVGMRGAN